MELINKQPKYYHIISSEETKHLCDFLEIKNGGLCFSITEDQRTVKKTGGFAESWELKVSQPLISNIYLNNNLIHAVELLEITF